MIKPTSCPRCDATILPDRRFCLRCGYDVHREQDSRAAVSVREWMVAEGRLPAQRLVMGGSARRITRRRLLGFGAASVVLGVAAYVVLSDESGDEDPVRSPSGDDRDAAPIGGGHIDEPVATLTPRGRD